MAAVCIQQGKLNGKITQNDNGFQYYQFLAIPYAKPPVGELRFKSPQPPLSWDGERDATVADKNNVALQVDIINGQIAGSEDCLYLNVFTPKLPDENSKLLPVMVFIHGGGFIAGNGILEDELGPDYLIEHNVIVVTINYRLSVLGFLSLDIPEAAGNMGLKDQVSALQWVQNNIIHFGGDKDNVTIFGVSAGAASVEYLIVSPKAKGLFHKAILQSGSCMNHWAVNYDLKKLAQKLAENLGYNGSLDDNKAIYEFLLKISGPALTETAAKISEQHTVDRLFFGFVPTVEKDFGTGETFLSENPYRLLKQGIFNQVPVIKGFCDKEGYLSNMLRPNAVLEVLENQNFTDHWYFDLDTHDKIECNKQLLQVYSENLKPDDDHDKLAVDFFSDLDFISGIWIGGQLMARKGVPVRFYEFCYEGKINFFKFLFGLKRKGAAHGDDHSYVLYHKLLKEACGNDLILRNVMTKMWTNFAKLSCPTPKDNLENFVEWPEYTEKDPLYLSINKAIEVRNNYEPKIMSIYRGIIDKYEK